MTATAPYSNPREREGDAMKKLITILLAIVLFPAACGETMDDTMNDQEKDVADVDPNNNVDKAAGNTTAQVVVKLPATMQGMMQSMQDPELRFELIGQPFMGIYEVVGTCRATSTSCTIDVPKTYIETGAGYRLTQLDRKGRRMNDDPVDEEQVPQAIFLDRQLDDPLNSGEKRKVSWSTEGGEWGLAPQGTCVDEANHREVDVETSISNDGGTTHIVVGGLAPGFPVFVKGNKLSGNTDHGASFEGTVTADLSTIHYTLVRSNNEEFSGTFICH